MKLETWKIDSVTYLLCRGMEEYAIWWAGCRVTPWVHTLKEICEGELLDKCYDATDQTYDYGYEYKQVECVTVDDPFGNSHELFLGLEDE